MIMETIDYNAFKLILVGTNEDGTKIYANLKYNKKTILKGFYSFDNELFIVFKYLDKNIPNGLSRNKIRKQLRMELLNDYDWEM